MHGMSLLSWLAWLRVDFDDLAVAAVAAAVAVGSLCGGGDWRLAQWSLGPLHVRPDQESTRGLPRSLETDDSNGCVSQCHAAAACSA